MENYDFEEISQTYEYGGKILNTSVTFFPEKSIATVTTTSENITGLDTEIQWYGMTLEELEHYFPPLPQQASQGSTFNLSKILRSIIFEASQKEGLDLEEGNVRNFWYTHIKFVVVDVLGLDTDASVDSAVNRAWGEVINSQLVTYEGMNIEGGKEDTRISVVKDSPFSNLIIAVEKMDYFHKFKWIPRLFNSTLITAGGQPSRAVARAFIRQLKDLGVDLDQDFYMCVASDLDPAGYYIQDAFCKQFESAIKAYGGYGTIEIRRLFVRRDQVSDNLLASEAMPCKDDANTESAKKAEDTKWEYFVNETGGGLYIPDKWNGKYPTHDINGVPSVRALLEMNAFPKSLIEKAITTELLKIIKETNDESKIMIPEIMRIFEVMRDEAIKEVFEEWKHKLIKPLINKFLQQTEDWFYEINDTFQNEKTDAEMARDEETDDIDERFELLIEEQKQAARDQEPELYDEQEELEREIAELENRLDEVNDEIHDKCSEIFEKIDELEGECKDEKSPFNEDCESEIDEARTKRDFRLAKLQQFREEHATVFNPLEMALLEDISEALSPEEVRYFFKDIELMEQFIPHISRLLTDPDLLEISQESCFDHPAPTFIERDLLNKAADNRDENIGGVRNAFTPDFRNEMKNLIRSHTPASFEVRGEIEDQDLSSEIAEAKSEIESAIEDGEHEA